MSTGFRLPHHAWLFLADCERGLLLRNEGEALRIDLKVVQRIEPEPMERAARDEGRPGRFNKGERTIGGNFRDDNAQHVRQATFAKRLAEELEAAVTLNGIEQLAVVAPPRLLGDLRTAFGPMTRRVVTNEIGRDLMHEPVEEIGRQLTKWTADAAVGRRE